MSSQFIWLASFPRSGNTLLRTILYHCFGLKSASVYPNDLAGNKALEEYIGHVELEADANGSLRFPTDRRWLVKTHELPPDDDDSIYVVRDGRAACVSYWEFYDRKTPLESIITGQTRFGAWSEHVNAWAPWTRSNCLLLKYEDMVEDMPSVIKAMSQYLAPIIHGGHRI